MKDLISVILKCQFVILFLLVDFGVFAQSDNPERRLDKKQGFEKLQLLVELSKENLNRSAEKALDYADTALDYAEELKKDDLTSQVYREINLKEANAYYFAGLAYEQLENSKSAISSFRKARRIAQRTQAEEMNQVILAKLAEYGKGTEFEVKLTEGANAILNKTKERALEDSTSNNELKKALRSTVVLLNESKAEKAIGELDYASAIELYKKNIPYHQSNGDSANLKRTYLLIADLYEKMD